MKALTLALAFSTVSFFAIAQEIKETEVPSVVMNSFKGQFSDAQKPEWEKLNDKYEVEFEQGTAERGAVLDASGKVLMLKQEIENNEVPAAVVNTIKQNYGGYDLDEAEKIEYNGKTYYEVELTRWYVLSKELIFTADGKETTLPF